jgi:hypothetical protein
MLSHHVLSMTLCSLQCLRGAWCSLGVTKITAARNLSFDVALWKCRSKLAADKVYIKHLKSYEYFAL